MKYTIAYTKYIILLYFFFLEYPAAAQQATVSCGGIQEGAAGSIASSIGQAFYHRISNNSYQINEGVLQPAENSEINQWLGGNVLYPNNWNTASNWSFNEIPEIENVIIDNRPHLPHISTTANCNNLYIKNGASALIHSNASETGSLIINGNFIVSGGAKLIARRYLSETKYHYISSPIAYENTDFMAAIETTSDALGFMGLDKDEVSGDLPTDNLWLWNQTTGYWEDLLHSNRMESEIMQTARGYVYGNNESNTLIMSGETNTDNVLYDAAYNPDGGGGFHLTGNPFCCDIAINTAAHESYNFLADNAAILDDNYEAVYIWQENENWNGGNCYKVICNNGFAGVSSGNSLENNFLEMGQAFMVKTDQAGTINFNKNIRRHGDSDFYKTKNDWPGIQLFIENGSAKTSTLLGFNNEMTTGLDPSYDAATFKSNPDLALYTKLVDDNGQDFAIQALPDIDIENFVIPVGVDVAENGVFEFSVYQEFLDNYNIVLEDRQENTFTNLRWDTYFATISESGIGRFYLHFKDATAVGEITHETNISFNFMDGKIKIQNPGGEKGIINLVNISGQILKRIELSGNDRQEFSTNQAGGIYIINIKTDATTMSWKLFLK